MVENWSFNTQPPEGGWPEVLSCSILLIRFQHTAARRRLVSLVKLSAKLQVFQHTAARRRLALLIVQILLCCSVSTHSRPKAAGDRGTAKHFRTVGFNTQPPEGGWLHRFIAHALFPVVSTHSRPKAAGPFGINKSCLTIVSTHSRPKAAGISERFYLHSCRVSTHSRPKAAGH